MLDLLMEGQIARLRLDRPEARNALRIADWATFGPTIAAAVDRGARVIVIEAEGSAFGAGADLRELATLASDVAARARFRQAMADGIAAVAGSAIPTVAWIDGACHGAAVALALAADIRVASPRARFAVPPAKFGIAYPQGDVDRLVARIGSGQASRLLLTGETIDAAEAARIGLVELVATDIAPILAAIADAVPASIALLRRQIAGLDRATADPAFEASFGSPEFAATAARIGQA